MNKKTGLVLEGGACRGVFTSGVLDVMLERGLSFDYCIGVSAGAGNAMNFKSRQSGRAYTLTAGDSQRKYFGLKQASYSRNLIDLDYLYETLSYQGAFPFDFNAYYKNPMVCEYVLSCCETGKAAYFREDVHQKRLLEIVKASSAMPGLCQSRTIDGLHYLDGGVTDALPVYRAFSQGCDKVVLVTTKPAENLHPTNYARLRPIFQKLYKKKYPAFFDTLMDRIPHYFSQLEEILNWEQAGKIFVIRPEHCTIKTLEKDREEMRRYYQQGKNVVKKQWGRLTNYLESE